MTRSLWLAAIVALLLIAAPAARAEISAVAPAGSDPQSQAVAEHNVSPFEAPSASPAAGGCGILDTGLGAGLQDALAADGAAADSVRPLPAEPGSKDLWFSALFSLGAWHMGRATRKIPPLPRSGLVPRRRSCPDRPHLCGQSRWQSRAGRVPVRRCERAISRACSCLAVRCAACSSVAVPPDFRISSRSAFLLVRVASAPIGGTDAASVALALCTAIALWRRWTSEKGKCNASYDKTFGSSRRCGCHRHLCLFLTG